MNNRLYTKHEVRDDLIKAFANAETDGWLNISYDVDCLRITTLDSGRIELNSDYGLEMALMLLRIENRRKELVMALDHLDHVHPSYCNVALGVEG